MLICYKCVATLCWRILVKQTRFQLEKMEKFVLFIQHKIGEGECKCDWFWASRSESEWLKRMAKVIGFGRREAKANG